MAQIIIKTILNYLKKKKKKLQQQKLQEGNCNLCISANHSRQLSWFNIIFYWVIKVSTVFSPKGCDLNINKARSTKLLSFHNSLLNRHRGLCKIWKITVKCVLIFIPWPSRTLDCVYLEVLLFIKLTWMIMEPQSRAHDAFCSLPLKWHLIKWQVNTRVSQRTGGIDVMKRQLKVW